MFLHLNSILFSFFASLGDKSFFKHSFFSLAFFINSEIMSRLTTLPGYAIYAVKQPLQPLPVPISRTSSPLLTSENNSILATVEGWDIICAFPIGKAASKYGCSVLSQKNSYQFC